MVVVEPLTPPFEMKWEDVKSCKCHNLSSKPTITQTTAEFLYTVSTSGPFMWQISFNMVFRNYTWVENKGLNNKVMVMGLHYLWCIVFTILLFLLHSSVRLSLNVAPVYYLNSVTFRPVCINHLSWAPLTSKNTQKFQDHTRMSNIHVGCVGVVHCLY